jgi:hypothetical protein
VSDEPEQGAPLIEETRIRLRDSLDNARMIVSRTRFLVGGDAQEGGAPPPAAREAAK